MPMETAQIIQISRFCTDDGPGIRTTVFLKGCPLSCAWCHNPESQQFREELLYKQEVCLHCGRCAAVCPNGCHALQDGVHTVHRRICTGCGLCVKACPAKALEIMGRTVTVQEVFDTVARDAVFYGSNGGVTVSGGEPLARPDFTAALLRRCKEAGIRTAIETSGFASKAAVETVVPLCDLVLFDLKETDPEKHKVFTGVPLAPILENLHRVDDMGIPTLLRLPVIPGWNDREEHLLQAKTVAASLRHCTGLEVMPYHSLGAYKYAQLGREYRCAQVAEPSKETAAHWRQLAGET